MEIKKLALATAVAASLAGLYGCSAEGDVATVTIEDNSDNSVTSTSTGVTDALVPGESTCPSFALPQTQIVQDEELVDVCGLPAVIDANQTLTSDKVWKLLGRVTVGNGNGEIDFATGQVDQDGATDVLDVTLSIEAGTSIIATKGTFANLIITRGSKIMAEGTAEAPIVFSSDDDDLDGSGEWGGLILHGYGQHNECWTGSQSDSSAVAGTTCNVDAEGESGFAGGFDNSDSSGVLQYVVVAEGGFEFAAGNEINGISFVGVGQGTTVEYIQVHGNADDGVEFYGGAVNAKYVVLTDNFDDSVDWDEGYQGNLQYVLVKQPEGAGNAVEADSEGNETLPFFSIPTLANTTFIAGVSKADVHVLKKASGGFFYNSVLDVPEATGFNCVNNDAAEMTLVAYENIVSDCETFYTDGTAAPASVTIVDPALNADYASAATAAVGLTALDLSAKEDADVDAVSDANAVTPSFFDATTFAGAVDPDAAEVWTAGWTVEGSL